MKLSFTLRFSWASPDQFASFRHWLFSVPTGSDFRLVQDLVEDKNKLHDVLNTIPNKDLAQLATQFVPTVKFKGIVVLGFSAQLLDILV